MRARGLIAGIGSAVVVALTLGGAQAASAVTSQVDQETVTFVNDTFTVGDWSNGISFTIDNLHFAPGNAPYSVVYGIEIFDDTLGSVTSLGPAATARCDDPDCAITVTGYMPTKQATVASADLPPGQHYGLIYGYLPATDPRTAHWAWVPITVVAGPGAGAGADTGASPQPSTTPVPPVASADGTPAPEPAGDVPSPAEAAGQTTGELANTGSGASTIAAFSLLSLLAGVASLFVTASRRRVAIPTADAIQQPALKARR